MAGINSISDWGQGSEGCDFLAHLGGWTGVEGRVEWVVGVAEPELLVVDEVLGVADRNLFLPRLCHGRHRA